MEKFSWHDTFTTAEFFNFLCPTSASILWRMCRYIRISDHVDYIWINVATKITLIVKHSYTKCKCEVLARYLTLARWPGSDLENMWKWKNILQSLQHTGELSVKKRTKWSSPSQHKGSHSIFVKNTEQLALDFFVHTHCYFVNGQLVPCDKHS